MVTTSDPENEVLYFAYSATLRISGADLPLQAISDELGIDPTHQHRRGESRRSGVRSYPDDAWHLQAHVSEECPLTQHLRELWQLVQPHVAYLKALDAKLDVFCGYRSNDGTAGFSVEPDALEIFTALGVPFEVSVIIHGSQADQPTKH